MFTKEHDRQAVRHNDPSTEPDLPRLQEPAAEAPDRGASGTEPPEDRLSRAVEAPDAGEGRAASSNRSSPRAGA